MLFCSSSLVAAAVVDVDLLYFLLVDVVNLVLLYCLVVVDVLLIFVAVVGSSFLVAVVDVVNFAHLVVLFTHFHSSPFQVPPHLPQRLSPPKVPRCWTSPSSSPRSSSPSSSWWLL